MSLNDSAITILGAGAIGHLLSAQLTQAGIHNQLLVRAAKVHDYRSYTKFNFEGYEQQPKELPINYCSIEQIEQIDWLFVTVKSYQLAGAFKQVLPKLNNQSTIVLMLNGLGHFELVTKLLSESKLDCPIILASITHGAILAEKLPAKVQHKGVGEIVVGNIKDEQQLEKAYQLLSAANLNPQISSDIVQTVYLKAAVNSVINPLTAIYRITNGELLTNSECQKQIPKLIDELSMLFEQLSIPISKPQLTQKINQVISDTAANNSSMLMDVLHNRTTEVDAINVFFINLAKKHGLHLASHLCLVEQIKHLEKNAIN